MKIFCFGLGYSALHFLSAQESVQASGTVRDSDKAEALRRDGVDALVFDGQRAEAAIAPRLAEAEALLVSIAPGAADPVLARFASAIGAMRRLRAIVYLSTIGVYGDHNGAWVDETSPTSPRSERGRARLGAEQQWRALGDSMDVPVHILRLAGIYGPERNLLTKLRAGQARRIVKPGQTFNRTHVEDIAQAIGLTLAAGGQGGLWNVADEEPAPPQDVIAFAAALLGMEPPPEEPFDTADMTPMARSFYADNKRVSIAKLKSELGFAPKYPTYREGLRALAAAGEGGR
ncbi:SDR family oxidoreductase [Methylocapsa sp. S129]|uniref:SDR family oxidoreductase n=1 Tax=Methylocapsa sp. S129 TaxID=1641869 RepID=UPI00131B9C61|nr:SDR family oxidoreductase [Methylocapsa sp. S129]